MNAQLQFARTAMLGCLLAAASTLNAASINFSSLETVLADPNDSLSKMSASWTGWATQLLEYNMPFIQLTNEPNNGFAIETFRMSIGDTNYQFSNIFQGKSDTNSYPFPANGEYAITGFSTPDVQFTTSVEDGGDTLVIDFGPGGLAPGETATFQVDIDADVMAPGMMLFADYTSVFFNQGGGPDTTGNSELELTYVGTNQTASLTLPNFDIGAAAQFLQAPRPYSIMQPVPVFPSIPLDIIPEPTSAVLAIVGLLGVTKRRV